MKWSIVHLSNLVIWPTLTSALSSSDTQSWKWMDTFRALTCLVISGSLKLVYTWWDLDLPSLVNNYCNFLTKSALISLEEEFSIVFFTMLFSGGFGWIVSKAVGEFVWTRLDPRCATPKRRSANIIFVVWPGYGSKSLSQYARNDRKIAGTAQNSSKKIVVLLKKSALINSEEEFPPHSSPCFFLADFVELYRWGVILVDLVQVSSAFWSPTPEKWRCDSSTLRTNDIEMDRLPTILIDFLL